MKLRFLSLLAAVAMLASCSSTRTSTSSNAAYAVPDGIQTTFITTYPNATDIVWSGYDVAYVPIDWELNGWNAMDASDYAVRFNMDGQSYYAWYDSDGNWIGSTYAVSDYNSLPTSVNTTLRNNFSGYSIKSVQREMWKDHMGYEIKLENGDSKVKVLVDENGNVIKQKNKY